MVPLLTKVMEDPTQRERLISAIETYVASKPRWVRHLQAGAFIVAGVVVIVYGMVLFDGAAPVVGGAFVAAGGAELASLVAGH
jgi:uncharacterized membrane protein HdeD (DUF308 family)